MLFILSSFLASTPIALFGGFTRTFFAFHDIEGFAFIDDIVLYKDCFLAADSLLFFNIEVRHLRLNMNVKKIELHAHFYVRESSLSTFSNFNSSHASYKYLCVHLLTNCQPTPLRSFILNEVHGFFSFGLLPTFNIFLNSFS